jgi:hypothetical protein
VANDLDTTFRVVSIQASQDFVVRETAGSLHGGILGRPCSNNLVVILYPVTLRVSMIK